MVNKYVKDQDVIITSSPGNGATSLALAISNQLTKDGELVLFYVPSNVLDINFIRRYYSITYHNTLFMTGNLDSLLEVLSEIGPEIDYLVIDPADILMESRKFIDSLGGIVSAVGTNLICISQIRQDPNHGGKPYSPLGKFNRTRFMMGNPIFKYSIWLRNATAPTELSIGKYADVFNIARSKNTGIDRYFIRFSKEGNVIK